MQRRLILFVMVILLGLSSSLTYAQEKITIKGKVLSATGIAPLSGVSVTTPNSTRGTVSNADGSFVIRIPAGTPRLVFSFVGYSTKILTIDELKNENFIVRLSQSKNDLDEVVVSAYTGNIKKTVVTGSILTLNGPQSVADKPYSSMDKALQGSVAGMQVSSTSGAPGSATNILLRGIGSISASTSPLWVIDGAVVLSGDLSQNTTTSNVLSSLNPDDIESISVLKDASAASIYGSRAANGVILVTTKKGKSGATHLNVVGQWGNDKLAFWNKNNRPMTTKEYMKAFSMALINDGDASSFSDAYPLMNSYFGLDSTVNTDWHKVVSKTGSTQSYNVSLSGGNQQTQFYASSGYFYQDGPTLATNYKRWNGALSVDHTSHNFTFNAGLSGSYAYQRTPLNGGTFGNPLLAAYFLLPWYTPYNSDGSLRYGDSEFPTGGGLFNPVVIAAYDKSYLKQTNVRGHVGGEYKILPNLKVSSKFSAEYIDIYEYLYNNPFYGDGYSYGGAAYVYDSKYFDWTWTNQAEYKLNLNANGDFNLDLLAGTEAYKKNYNLLNAAGTSFPQTLALTDLSAAGTPTKASTSNSYNTTASYFSNAILNFKDRYILTASFRRDGSSVFGANHKWGNFYSVGASWNITNEKFLQDSKWINLLKLRASYGENGNNLGFNDYSSIPVYTYGYNYNGNAGALPTNPGNTNLTWEKNNVFDIGLDYSIVHDRLSGTIDYYNRKTTKLLILVPLSYTTGYSNGEYMNVGSMNNRGIEFSITGKPIVTNDFSWTVSFNIAHNRNRVTKLYNGNPITNSPFEIAEGHDFQEYYLRNWAGVDPTNGNALWNKNGPGTDTTSSYSNVNMAFTGKSASPKYFGGFTNSFRYKDLTLDVTFSYNFGNYVDVYYSKYFNSDGAYYGSYESLNTQLNAWTPDNTHTNTPKLVYGNATSSNANSSRYLYNGKYIRLRNLQLNYALPKNLISRYKLNNLSLFISASNLLTFDRDKYIPVDPEQGSGSTANLNVPATKTISAGVKLGL